MGYIKITKNKSVDIALNVLLVLGGLYAIGYILGANAALIQRLFS